LQKLHLVGLTTDLSGLIFSARKGSKSGSYVVPVDARLLAVIADTLSRRNGDAPAGDVDLTEFLPDEARPQEPPARPPRPTSALSPREIQARLRGGRTVEEFAKEAGVDAAWVERFAAPILAEQGRIVDRAVALVYVKPRVGPSALPIGAAVRRNLVARGVRLTDDEFNSGWSAYQLEDARWVVRFRYRSRGRAQLAEWELDLDDPADVLLVARNRLGGQLAYSGKARRRPRPAAAPTKKSSSPAAAKKRPLVAKKVAPKAAKSAKSSSAKKGATMKRAAARPRPRPAR
jgi:hypothetical protein